MNIPALAFFEVEFSAKRKALQLLENPTHVSEHLKKKRLELRLKQSEVAVLIGVSEDCITYWENKRSQPQIKHYLKIIQFLGYNPFPVDDNTIGGKIKKYRIEHGLSIKRLAKKLRVEDRILASWERDETSPNKTNLQKIQELIS